MSSSAPRPTRALRHASAHEQQHREQHPVRSAALPAIRARRWRRTAPAANRNAAGRRAGSRKANGRGTSERQAGRGPQERARHTPNGRSSSTGRKAPVPTPPPHARTHPSLPPLSPRGPSTRTCPVELHRSNQRQPGARSHSCSQPIFIRN